MDQTESLLQAVWENGRMGEDSLKLLIDDCSGKLRQDMAAQKARYADAARDAEQRLYAMDLKPRAANPVARAGLWMGMRMNTLTNKSEAHIADILVQGATMGILDLTKARNSNPDADANAQGIAAALIESQQAFIDQMKAYLYQEIGK